MSNVFEFPPLRKFLEKMQKSSLKWIYRKKIKNDKFRDPEWMVLGPGAHAGVPRNLILTQKNGLWRFQFSTVVKKASEYQRVRLIPLQRRPEYTLVLREGQRVPASRAVFCPPGVPARGRKWTLGGVFLGGRVGQKTSRGVFPRCPTKLRFKGEA